MFRYTLQDFVFTPGEVTVTLEEGETPVLLGYSLGAGRGQAKDNGLLFCSYEDVVAALETITANRRELRAASLKALETGYQR